MILVIKLIFTVFTKNMKMDLRIINIPWATGPFSASGDFTLFSDDFSFFCEKVEIFRKYDFLEIKNRKTRKS